MRGMQRCTMWKEITKNRQNDKRKIHEIEIKHYAFWMEVDDA